MADIVDSNEYPGLEALFKALDARLTSIETGQRELRAEFQNGLEVLNCEQQKTNVHLARLNGTGEMLEKRTDSHSGKLCDHDGKLAEYFARLAVVEKVTEVRDEHQAQGIRNAAGDAWAAQQTAHDVRGETIGWIGQVKQAAITAMFIAGFLVAIGGVLVAVLR